MSIEDGAKMADDIIDVFSNPARWGWFEDRLQEFDWYYPMSDDHRVWTKGEEQKKELNKLIIRFARLDEERTRKLVLEYQPQMGVRFY